MRSERINSTDSLILPGRQTCRLQLQLGSSPINPYPPTQNSLWVIAPTQNRRFKNFGLLLKLVESNAENNQTMVISCPTVSLLCNFHLMLVNSKQILNDVITDRDKARDMRKWCELNKCVCVGGWGGAGRGPVCVGGGGRGCGAGGWGWGWQMVPPHWRGMGYGDWRWVWVGEAHKSYMKIVWAIAVLILKEKLVKLQ